MALVHVLYLPLPGDLPAEIGSLSAVDVTRLSGSWPGAIDLLPEFRTKDRDRLLRSASRPVGMTVVPEPDSFDAEALEQDHFFFVVRVAGASTEAFFRALLVSCGDAIRQAEDMGTRVTPAEWNVLLDAVDAMLALANVPHLAVSARWSPPTRPEPPESPTRLANEGTYQPHLRWLIGHHLFFALIQAIIVSLNLLHAATVTDGRVSRLLDVTTKLIRASATSMRFTADFAPQDYTDHVRPSMMPPHVGPGFSGLQGMDHRHLISQMRGFRADFDALSDLPAMAAFRAAMREMLTAHTHVCERFGGGVHPSLRMDAKARRSTNRRPAIQVTAELAERRYQLVDPTGSARRSGVFSQGRST